MPTRTPFPLGIDEYESESLPYAAKRCINLFAVIPPTKALDKSALFGTPGTVNFATAGTLCSRGAATMNGVYYVINNTTLYSIDSMGVATSKGTIAGTARVIIAHNAEKMVIVVPGGKTYEYNQTPDTLVDTTAATNWQTASSVVYKDGYFIFTATDLRVFFNSELSFNVSTDLTFLALDSGTAEISPDDDLITCHVTHDELYIFGEHTTEVFQNVGGSGFPWQRIPGASYEKGAHSKYSVVQWEGAFYFAGGGLNEKTGIWVGGSQGEPQKISTDAIDDEILNFTREEIASSFSFAYSIRGYSFVGFTFRSINTDSKTFLFNVTATRHAQRPVWFEQQSGITDNAWRVQSIDFVYNKLIVSDFVDGRVGYLDEDTYTEYGETITRIKTTAPLEFGGAPFFVGEIELTPESGVGISTGLGSDPLVTMDYSDDGARTWSNSFQRSLGKIGEYMRRVSWRRLGRVPAHRVFRFVITDPVKVSLIKLEMVLDGGQ